MTAATVASIRCDWRNFRIFQPRSVRNGENVSQTEYALAVSADVTRGDLDALALRLTAVTGLEHRVWRTRDRGLAVYPCAYKEALGLLPA